MGTENHFDAAFRERASTDEPADTSRRRFLRNTLIGAAGVALPVACSTSEGATEGAANATVGTVGQPSTTVPTPTPTPQVPNPISPTSAETWREPWIWRPSDWPGEQLQLNIVENENPGPIVGFGNQSAVLFSYNGATPGPTIRMRGDEILYVRLRNLLGENFGTTFVGPYPDPAALPGPDVAMVSQEEADAKATALGNARVDYCLGEHTNGVHSTRTTNLHTHGLHVRPGRNPDGTHSDNVILRVINQADFRKRQEQRDDPACDWLRDPEQTTYLRDDEQTGTADYEFRIGNVQGALRAAAAESEDELPPPPQPHPPGTHWYHPHAHGATHNQVSSGMAGFLIVEGDVDEAINFELTGNPNPDPQIKTGPYRYIERLMFIQRVFVNSNAVDPDAPEGSTLRKGGAAFPAVNGDQTPMVITMRPGAVERWRVLNGSVDGRGYKRFMVVEGQYHVEQTGTPGNTTSVLVKLRDDGTFTRATRSEVVAGKQQLYQLAFDGITLVEGDADEARYVIQDLAKQNPDGVNALNENVDFDGGMPNASMLEHFEACFENATAVKGCFVQPNEVYMGPANRTDIMFQAPDEPGTYTVLARAVVAHGDNYQATLQSNVDKPDFKETPQDIIVAYVIVGGDPAVNGQGQTYDLSRLQDVLPPVPPYLMPIGDDEVQVREAEPGRPADPDANISDRVGKYRTRTITYSGWGAADYPLVTTADGTPQADRFRAFVEDDLANGDESLEKVRYAELVPDDDHPGPDYVLLAPQTRSMAITGGTGNEIIDNSDPHMPIRSSTGRKFSPNDPTRPLMLESTAEEWAVYNYSISLWADTTDKPFGQSGGHYCGQPLVRGEGQEKFAEDPKFRMTTKSVDHPFHIHQNPCWVMRIEIPDANGDLVNILDKPRWQDVQWVPRNGGRIVFRSRFPDYIGAYVNHCHILLHEDNGMMQVIEVTPFADQANYELKDDLASSTADATDVSEIYPRFDQERQWEQSMQFVDPNPHNGQKFPGFVVGPPPQ